MFLSASVCVLHLLEVDGDYQCEDISADEVVDFELELDY